MNSSMTAIGLAILAIAAPAAAQQQAAPAAGQQQQAAEKPTITPSKQAHEAIVALNAAVEAKDVANIPARVAAAEAVARTAEDRYLIAVLRLKAAHAADDKATVAAAIESLLASGKLPPTDVVPLTLERAVALHELKQYGSAAAAFEQVLQADPNNTDALVMLGETRNAQGRTADAVTLMRRAIAQKKASGAVAKEQWYKRAVALAYNAKLPVTAEASRDWLAAYPTSKNWSDALKIYRELANPDEAIVLDTLRLARATGALAGDADFHRYAYLATSRGFPGEVKAVMDEAIAARAIDPNKELFKDIIAEVDQKAAGDRATLDDAARAGLEASEARKAVVAGDLHYGYGEYAKAAELYRAALGKQGADKDLINLRLGMALARAGDKAGATAALGAVGGARAELAKYWQIYVNTRA